MPPTLPEEAMIEIDEIVCRVLREYIEAEREACAKVAEEYVERHELETPTSIGAAIRART